MTTVTGREPALTNARTRERDMLSSPRGRIGLNAPIRVDKPDVYKRQELYLQAFFPGNVPPIISQMALGPIWENVEDPTLFRFNQNALIFTRCV